MAGWLVGWLAGWFEEVLWSWLVNAVLLNGAVKEKLPRVGKTLAKRWQNVGIASFARKKKHMPAPRSGAGLVFLGRVFCGLCEGRSDVCAKLLIVGKWLAFEGLSLVERVQKGAGIGSRGTQPSTQSPSLLSPIQVDSHATHTHTHATHTHATHKHATMTEVWVHCTRCNNVLGPYGDHYGWNEHCCEFCDADLNEHGRETYPWRHERQSTPEPEPKGSKRCESCFRTNGDHASYCKHFKPVWLWQKPKPEPEPHQHCEFCKRKITTRKIITDDDNEHYAGCPYFRMARTWIDERMTLATMLAIKIKEKKAKRKCGKK